MQQKGQFILMNQQEFKDWLMEKTFNRLINLIQEHHTCSPTITHFKGDNHFAMVESMKIHHVRNAGCTDIAQNIILFPDGLIMVCRDFEKAPSGIKGCNANAICIESVGSYDTGDTITPEQKASILFVTAVLCIKFKLTPSVDTITYHHWWDLNTGKRTFDSGCTKACPSNSFFGGNTVEDAKLNFYPAVNYQIYELQKPAYTVQPCNLIKKVTASSLNLRRDPYTYAPIIGQVIQGTIVKAIGDVNNGQWYQIQMNGKTGYVAGQYLESFTQPQNTITTIDEALYILTQRELINNAEYWKINCVNGKMVDGECVGILMMKVTNTLTVNDAINQLRLMGVISSTTYWTANAVAGRMVEGQFMNIIVVRLANLIN